MYGANANVQVCMQDLDVAIIKATTSQFHVVPKEKHVRSESPNCPASPDALPGFFWRTPVSSFHSCSLDICHAALKQAVHVSRSRQDVSHVKMELLKRLRKASDWLVRS